MLVCNSDMTHSILTSDALKFHNNYKHLNLFFTGIQSLIQNFKSDVLLLFIYYPTMQKSTSNKNHYLKKFTFTRKPKGSNLFYVLSKQCMSSENYNS